MIDTSAAKWDFSKEEKYAVKWLNDHGFSGTLDKQFVSKTKFTVSKDGLTLPLEIFNDANGYDVKKSMELFGQSFEQSLENRRLKQELAELRSKQQQSK